MRIVKKSKGHMYRMVHRVQEATIFAVDTAFSPSIGITERLS